MSLMLAFFNVVSSLLFKTAPNDIGLWRRRENRQQLGNKAVALKSQAVAKLCDEASTGVYPTTSTEAWINLSEYLCPPTKDSRFWWRMLGPPLAVMLREAGYDLHGQYEGLLFYFRYIIARLGMRPTVDGLPSNWKSFMTDDYSPIELSWSWDTTERPPMIRYSIEAIGSAAGTSVDPFNQAMTADLVHHLQLAASDVDWQWYNQLSRAFGVFEKAAIKDDSLIAQTGSSSVFLAFEIRNGGPAVKAYFAPLRSTKTEESYLAVFSDGVKSLECGNMKFPAYDQLIDFMTASPEGSLLKLLGAAIDCVHHSKSRLKIYARSPSTSFNSVRDIMTLGGKINSHISESALEELQELWRSTLRCNEPFSPIDQLPSLTHQTSGILYNFDIKPGNNIPEPKIYIPVRHYGIDDWATAQGLRSFLQKRGRDRFIDNYEQVLQGLCPHRPLDSHCGIQTYIACSMTKAGSLSITSYFSPEIYHPARWSK